MVSQAAWRWRGTRNGACRSTATAGSYADLLQLHSLADPQTAKQYEDYIARLNDVPRYFDENIANMRQGMRDGFTLPSAILEGVARVVDGRAIQRSREDAVLEAVREVSRRRAGARACAAGGGGQGRADRARSSRPMRRSSVSSMPSTGRRRARRSAPSALPGGRAYYADLVRYFTTLPDATPEGDPRDRPCRGRSASAPRWKRSCAR